MKPGVYVHTDNDNRFLASIDDIRLGDGMTQDEIEHDLFNILRDNVVELVGNDDDVEIGKITIYIVQ